MAREIHNGSATQVSVYMGITMTDRRTELVKALLSVFKAEDHDDVVGDHPDVLLSITLPPADPSALPFVIEADVTTARLDDGDRYFLDMDFIPLDTYGKLDAALEEDRSQGRSVECFIEKISEIVGGEETFSIVRVDGLADATPAMVLPFGPIEDLEPLVVGYRSKRGGARLLEVQWQKVTIADSPNRFAFLVTYGMVDTWVAPKPWETEVARALTYLAETFPG